MTAPEDSKPPNDSKPGDSNQASADQASLEALVHSAQGGDRQALEALLPHIQDDIHHLAMRMLCDPDDARDATQEIMIRVITKLSTFAFKSRFKTWVYRLACNYLLTAKKVLAKNRGLSFDQFEQDLLGDLADPGELAGQPDYDVLLNEVRIGCTTALMLCLDDNHRVAYILGEILDADAPQAAEILQISAENFRQRLSRARSKVLAFTRNTCGLVNNRAPCTCPRKLRGAMARGRVDPQNIRFGGNAAISYREVEQVMTGLQKAKDSWPVKALQQFPNFPWPQTMGNLVTMLFQGIDPDTINTRSN